MRVALEGISKSYDDHTVLDGVSLEAADGECVVLLGESGSGKTTLLFALAGLVPPDEGRILLGDRVANDPAVRIRPRDRGVGMVFQDLALWPHMTAAEHLAFVAPGTDPMPLLAELGLAGHVKARPDTFSGGEARRLAIARALATDPGLLLLDEPMGSLDRPLRDRLLDRLTELRRSRPVTTLYVTHDYEEAFRLADRVGILEGGRIVQVGSPAEVYDRPATAGAAGLTGPVTLLPAEPAGDGCVRTALGDLLLMEGLTASAGCLVPLRPERIRIEPDAGPAVVESCRPDGGRWIVRVRTEDTAVLAYAAAPVEPGRPVAVVVDGPVRVVPAG